MKKFFLTILTITLTLTGTLTVAAQTGRQLKVYIKGGLVDKVRVDGDASIGHSRTDLNGTVHDDFVSMVITDSEGRERQYLISQLDSLVMPNGRRVVFVGYQNENQNQNENGKGSRSNQRRTSFEGEFPGTVGKNVTFFWTENDHIRLDVGDESRATNLTNDKKSANFIFEDADLDASSYRVYYPDKTVTILNVQTQTGADNTEHIGRSGDCGIGTARRNGNGNDNGNENDNENENGNSPTPNTQHLTPTTDHPSPTTYTFTLEHQAAYLCFLPHIDNLPSVKLTKITLSCSAAIAGTYLLRDNGLSDGSSTSTSITLNLNPLGENDFFIGHDVQLVQSDCAAYMVIAPQTANCDFTATYFVTDTLSRISKMYRQTFKLKPEANTVYPVTCRIADEEFRTIDLGLSCSWANVNVGATEPRLSGPGYATDSDANAALLAQTVVTQWLLPDEDQRNELLTKCEWTAGEYNGASGYFVEGAAVAKEYGEKLRIFLPCTAGSTKAQCLAQNRRPVEALMVDLGLSSGVKWAVRNVGATSVEDYGNYYAWGEVEPKETYTTANNMYGAQALGENFDISGTQNDVAAMKWGGLWRMPTKTEMEELKDSCSWTWSTINGINGFIVEKKTGGTGNKIFLPSAGYVKDGSHDWVGSSGSYFTSTGGDLNSNRTGSDCAWTLSWRSDYNAGTRYFWGNSNSAPFYYGGDPTYRYIGRSVRPVASPNAIDKDGNSYHIRTDSTVWRWGNDVAVLYGSLSSGRPVMGMLTVGFVIGDSAKVDTVTARFNLSKTVSAAGSFNLSQPVHDNFGYWYRAYLKTADSIYYGEARHYGCEMVNLGLPSGTLWANMNVGANKPSDYGKYYAWGETEPKTSYNDNTVSYPFGSQALGYDFDISGTEHDVAHVKMGNAWRMPTKIQMAELQNECRWEWTTEDGVNGFKVIGPNGNSVFLPSAGYIKNSYHDWAVSSGCYVTSTGGDLTGNRTGSDCAWTLSWRSDYNSGTRYFWGNSNSAPFYYGGDPTYRYIGRTVRAVANPNAVKADSTVVMNILTDSATWKVNATSCTIFGTVSSTTPIAAGTKVGFVVGDSANITKANATVYEQPTTGYGSFSQLITDIPDNFGYWYRAYIETSDSVYYGPARHFGWEMIDLGLASGTKWVSMNVGASSPEEYGNYYAWGETLPKSSYEDNITNYPLRQQNPGGYTDIAGTAYDAATQNMGSLWHTPTKAQMEELKNLPSSGWIWTTLNDVNGFMVTGANGNSIFLPCAGYIKGTSRDWKGSSASYVTSTMGDNKDYVWTLSWRSDKDLGKRYFWGNGNSAPFYYGGDPTYRYIGRTVRAVSEGNTVPLGCNILTVETQPIDWTSGPATLKGTLTSTRTLASNVTVGFRVTDHYNAEQATTTTYYDVVVSATGEFSKEVTVPSGGLYYTAYIKVGDRYHYAKPCHVGVMVDLGLPSGTLWASKNIGAQVPENYGNYYTWGETSVKDKYTSENNLYGTQTLNSGNIQATPYDAAYVSMGEIWCLPTKDQMEELMNDAYCDWTWETINGISGYRVTGKASGYTNNSIFLPAAGYWSYDYFRHGNSGGIYMTATQNTSNTSFCYVLNFTSTQKQMYSTQPNGNHIFGTIDSSEGDSGNALRYVGHSVRAVAVARRP